MSEVAAGYVEKIVFRNEENGYTVLSLNAEEEEVTCVGIFPFINEGEYIEVTGEYTSHQIYGEQLKVAGYQVKEPEDIASMERYLGSGAIKGIGKAMAARIVRRFKGEAFRIIEEEPERLAEIKGISERIARQIGIQFQEKREMRGAMLFLQQYGISANLAAKIYKAYGAKLYDVIRENPYRLADDIHGVGFKIADEIAVKAGILSDSGFRIKAGILYILLNASAEGHVYLPEEELIKRSAQMLLISQDKVTEYFMELMLEKRIVVKEELGRKNIYGTSFYYMELNCARMLLDLNISCQIEEAGVLRRMRAIEKKEKIELDHQQRTAIMETARNGLLVITGGPGTGKTTTINSIIQFFQAEGMEILLAAPTGRAAKRMTETTGYEARTIHRLLELNGSMSEEERGMRFERNECNPLEADIIIIDEVSMVDISLMTALLKAISVGTRLVLVGDVNQLPSVGPGNVLKDIISSQCFPVVKLTRIFRQAAESDIIVNAHKINKGQNIAMDNKSRDFFMLKRDNSNVIISILIQLIQAKLPKYVEARPYDIQVLTPMRKGELGVARLNEILQQYLNPPSPDKKEKETGAALFREGDKVMQVKNNYQLEWEVRNQKGYLLDSGAGVFNGDCGLVKEINLFAETLTVEFEEGKTVEYGFSSLDELELAYAITIHKSQGSEYPAVVMPILTGPRMLFNRNLLYTAITRAKKCVTIVGDPSMVQYMIENANEQKRYSGLALRIKEMWESPF